MKSNLIASLDNYYNSNKAAKAAIFSTFDITPVTFISTFENREQELLNLKEAFYQKEHPSFSSK